MDASEFEPRIALAPSALEAMGPPIALFKLFARNVPMAEAMTGWGRFMLGRQLSVPMRIREIVIDRVTALCGAEYEWGVHVAFYGARIGLTDAQLRSLTHGSPEDPCWTAAERAVLLVVDQLHATNDVDDEGWAALRSHFSDVQALDLLLLTGWYHAISFVARAARVPYEPGAARFTDYAEVQQ
jgi:alkylhydroperoxidase family enzyme